MTTSSNSIQKVKVEETLDRILITLYTNIDSQKGNQAWTEPFNSGIKRAISVIYKEYNDAILSRLKEEAQELIARSKELEISFKPVTISSPS